VELTRERAYEVLERTPVVVRALLSGLSDAWLDASEGPDTYTPRDVLGHLVFGEETDWLPRTRIILDHGEARPFTPFDREGFRKSGDQDAEAMLDRFARLRSLNLAEHRALVRDDALLQRTGTHPELGRVTLGQLLAAWAVHDLGHVKQIARVLARQYTDAVGPWRQYLTILDRPEQARGAPD
jgi:hypothetical protein